MIDRHLLFFVALWTLLAIWIAFGPAPIIYITLFGALGWGLRWVLLDSEKLSRTDPE